MHVTISNINPATNDLPFISVNVHIQDTENLGQEAIFHLLIDQGDALLSEIKDLSRDKVKEFLNAILQEIDYAQID